MAIQFKGSLGAGPHGISASSYNFVTAVTTIEVDELGVLVSAADNTTTTDGSNNEHLSVTDTSGNTWTKQAEFTHSPTGVAGDGVTVAIWTTQATAQLVIGSTITLSFNGARTEKTCVGCVFTFAPGGSLGSSASPVSTQTTGTVGFGAATFSGLASLERLWFRGLGKEVNVVTALTPTAGYTSIGGTRSNNITTAVIARAEYLISTDTDQTSNPTLNATGDTAGLFLALKELILNPSPDIPKASLTITGNPVTLALKINLPGET